MRALKLIGVAFAMLIATFATATGAAANGEAPAASYTISVTNITDTQYLTPPNFAAHDNSVHVFERNEPASPGVQAVAENGAVPVLAEELATNIDGAGLGVSGVVGQPVPLSPGETRTTVFETDERRFSVVSMVICTNDGFGGIDSALLPIFDGQTRDHYVIALDAGTEVNTEVRTDLVPAPFCGPGGGTFDTNPELAENGVITRHTTLRGVGDLDPSLDWRGPVMKVSVTRNAAPAEYDLEFENLTDGQYLTPPNFAGHVNGVHVFERGQAASPGVQAVAENGAVPVLADELTAAIDDNGLGTSAVAGPAVPLSPGEVRSAELATFGDRLSVVSMVVCTNDGFAGLDSRRLPTRSGDSSTFYLVALDAGTEINTENRADLVPAPFCGPGGGTEETNPELAENGVIRFHQTLQGTGDLDPSLDWSGPVLRVTVTRR